MFRISRFLTPVLAAAVIAAMTSATQAQFFFWERSQPQRKIERNNERNSERATPPRALEPMPVGEKASFNDTARFLAGVAPADDSPLAKYTRDPSWQAHARSFDGSWRALEGGRLSKIRAWSAQHIKDGKAPLYYMFSGPDLLYADAFFPNATTYILAGLEPVGHIPQISPRVISSLGGLRHSMASSISLSFFITKNMKSQLRETVLSGTLPILMVYAARAGKTITDISLISLDPDGKVTPVTPGSPRGVQGVKMVFGGAGKPEQTLYYFSTDISDGGLKASGFLNFAEQFGPGDAMFKAASYLPHSGGFSQIREFVLSKANNIVQDDSGIPVHYFKRDQWTFHPFGRYLGPIGIFPGRHQAQLDEIFRRGQVQPLNFGMGYRWRPNESNMLWAVRKDAGVPIAAPAVLRPSIPEPAPQAAPAAPVAPPQQEAKPMEAAPGAQPQREAKPVEVAPETPPQQEAKPATEPVSAPATANPAAPPPASAEQSASSSEPAPVRR
ncbi:MAG: hypothetical protein ABW198_03900 [Pseudorhodoplanes sp.]